MFTSWSPFVDTKYRLYTTGQGFVYLDGSDKPDKSLYFLALGSYKIPTTITYYTPKNTYLSYVKITQPKYKNLIQIDNSFAMAATDLNKNGYEEILVTHNEFNKKQMSLFYYDSSSTSWKVKKFPNPSKHQNGSVTVVPQGFLVGNITDPPYLMKWNYYTSTLEPDYDFVQYDPKRVKKFYSRSIMNMKGLIKGVDGLILHGDIKKKRDPENTFEQSYFRFSDEKLVIYPWFDTTKMNTTSAAFVNVNPEKGIYGFVFGNWAQLGYMYLFQKGKYLNRFTFQGGYTTCVVVADFDNDGKDEIYFANGYIYNTLYKVHDENNIEAVNVGQAYNNSYFSPRDNYFYESASAMDMDGDGFLELYTNAGYAYALGNNWFKVSTLISRKKSRYLRVFPLTKELAPHRGAVVKIKFGKKVYKRIIENGGNAMSQSEPIAHFGLGNYKGTVDVTVKWTNGKKTHIKDVSSNQVLRVVYDKE